MNKTLRSKEFPSGTSLELVQGDLTLTNVDAIVNPANSQLLHGGGLAGVLARKAGPNLQQESKDWIQEHGPVKHDKPAFTSAGNLPYKHIIHAVGPVWGSGEEKRKLADAIRGSLVLAGELGLTSLALPAISTGIFGYPLTQAAEVILETVNQFLLHGKNELLLVQIVLFDSQAADAFAEVWERAFS
jgi:O-acetyl-ADP-ribose deacetylase (regulator of RNase III)